MMPVLSTVSLRYRFDSEPDNISEGVGPFLACIEQREVIEKILTHLGLWPTPAHSPPESMAA